MTGGLGGPYPIVASDGSGGPGPLVTGGSGGPAPLVTGGSGGPGPLVTGDGVGGFVPLVAGDDLGGPGPPVGGGGLGGPGPLLIVGAKSGDDAFPFSLDSLGKRLSYRSDPRRKWRQCWSVGCTGTCLSADTLTEILLNLETSYSCNKAKKVTLPKIFLNLILVAHKLKALWTLSATFLFKEAARSLVRIGLAAPDIKICMRFSNGRRKKSCFGPAYSSDNAGDGPVYMSDYVLKVRTSHPW